MQIGSASCRREAGTTRVEQFRPWGSDSMTALYGETITIPCNSGAPAPAGLMFVKWKYEKADGTPGDLLIKQAQSDQATVQATDDYAQRVSIDDKYNLLITKATLSDQKTFTCMVVSGTNLMEYSVTVSVSSKFNTDTKRHLKSWSNLRKELKLGTCVATDANPRAEITWTKNGQLMVADGKAVVIIPSLKVNPATGLSTTSSTLQYVATKEDADAVFVCVSTHELITEDAELEPFAIHYPSETVSLQIMSKKPVVEGDNVTLKCNADGNPPPSSYFFHLKGQKTLVENSDTYTLTSISREAAGEYKCTLPDNEKMEDTQNIVVSYLDLNISLSGKVVKKVGEALSVQTEKSGSGDVKVTWMKEESSYVNNKATHKITVVPRVNLTVTCIVSNKLGEDVRTINVSSDLSDRHRCSTPPRYGAFSEAPGSTSRRPDDAFKTHFYSLRLTVGITLESQEDSDDQAKLIVGVVAGLLIAAAVATRDVRRGGGGGRT
ncbi:CD166 antigen -like protein [Collichthys lucidus]|uniref:CD166 antigen-like protein n=1 Tax=Collichthys lucidus TaxID=240159 RepID=A0A4V6ARB3_COLLU|nr:CD166 antigen -like protein [Collichthys lucidus]